MSCAAGAGAGTALPGAQLPLVDPSLAWAPGWHGRGRGGGEDAQGTENRTPGTRERDRDRRGMEQRGDGEKARDGDRRNGLAGTGRIEKPRIGDKVRRTEGKGAEESVEHKAEN